MGDDVLLRVESSVFYTEQTLTEEQKAQARENIGAVTEEDWQLLCDTTTTEEIVNFGIDTDMDGNPFSCRKIVAQMILPQPMTASTQPYFGNALGLWQGDPCAGINAHWQDCKIYDFQVELVKNKFAILRFSHRIEDMFIGGYQDFGIIRHTNVAGVQSLTKFFVANGYTENPFPVGTRFLVWGCKA